MAFSARRRHSAPRDAPDHEALRDLSSRILRTSQLNFGQNFGTVWRNSNGVLKMRGGFSIGGYYRPTVLLEFYLVGCPNCHWLGWKNKTPTDILSLSLFDVIY